jgi:hypothetical protein
VRIRLLTAFVLSMVAAVAAPAAHATIPQSLKDACTTQSPHAGYSYKLCDDGIPLAGGIVPNLDGAAAVTVPAKYEGYTGLPEKASDAADMRGADANGDVALDVDVSLPTTPAPPGGYPLLVFMHGCCSGSKASWESTSFDGGGELWHYNNAWFASRGYVVLNYTARGFVNGETNGDRGSTGETQLDSRQFEVNDYQSLAGQLADDAFFNVNPQKVVVTGGSYGGGFAWLALTDPTWDSPAGTPMKLASVAPKYGWTDLVYSLVPTGRHSQTPGALPAFDGSDSMTPIGIPKRSIVAALYDSGRTGIPPGSAHTTFPQYIDQAFGCLQSTDPYETNPACTETISNTLPSFISDRSAYYQNDWFNRIAFDPAARVPIFNAGTFTDPLFTPVENRRMVNRIKSVVPGYPVQEYYGDYQHFVQNKAKEWGDICGADHHVCRFADYPGGDVNATPTGLVRTGATTRLNRFIDHYAQPSGNPSQPQPAFDVTAALQTCPQNASAQNPADEPGDTFTAPSFGELTRGVLQLDMSGSQTTLNNVGANPHGVNSDPVGNFAANGGKCPVETQTAGPGVAVYDSAPLTTTATMIGATTLSIDYSATPSADGLQLNSRLYDVFPDGSAVMVDRGIRRVTSAAGTVTYQLNGNGWRFPAGHRIRIEVAQDDNPYLRPSTIPSTTTVTHVHLAIPVREAIGYPRPKGASPFYVSLVTAYQPCTAANRQHAAPLAFGSCNPPSRSSSWLTSGTPDANGAQANFSGFVRFATVAGDPSTPADEADVRIDANVVDVRNASNLSDYAGELQAVVPVQLTDRNSGDNEPATMQSFAFSVTVPCAATADTSIGGTCAVSTTGDAVMPGAIVESKRSVWELGQLEVRDGGADGLAATDPNTVFARQGVFTP